jgi:hypothetical protein
MSAIVQAYQVANASERGEPVMRAMKMDSVNGAERTANPRRRKL